MKVGEKRGGDVPQSYFGYDNNQLCFKMITWGLVNQPFVLCVSPILYIYLPPPPLFPDPINVCPRAHTHMHTYTLPR